MNNSSLHSRIARLCWSYTALLLATLLTINFTLGFHPSLVIFLILGIGLSIWGQRRLRQSLAPVAEAVALAEKIGQGNFSSRICGVPDTDEIGRLIWSLNDMMDQIEAYFREAESSFRAQMDGRYERMAQSAGLHGSFHEASEAHNTLLTSMAGHTRSQMKNMLLTNAGQLNAGNLIINLTGGQADLIGITSQMRKAAAAATQTAEEAAQNQGSVTQVVSHLANIGGRIHAVADAVTELNARSQEINQSVNLITEISDQTNLLALNAAIEAARAGESGRGFAVVADEVRKLAEKTRAASQSIGKIMNSLSRDGEAMQENAQAMREMTESSSAVVGELANTFGRFATSARETERQSILVHDKSFTTLVKMDHMIYKQRTYLALNSGGDSQYIQPVAVTHEQCRLGKWYLGEGRTVFGNQPAYRALDKPHAKVHTAAHRVLAQMSLAWDSDSNVQMAIVDALTEMEAGSRDVMDLLDRMVVENHPDAATL
jgi:methyl-accepting chemotaxis protein